MSGDPGQVRATDDPRRPFAVLAGPGAAPPARGGLTLSGYVAVQGPIITGDVTLAVPQAAQQEDEYLQALAAVYSYWRTEYIPGSAQGPRPFMPGDTDLMQRRRAALRPAADPASDILCRRPVALLDAITLYPRLLLLGGPGAGKTSYLQYLALQWTAPAPPVRGLLPVLVDLSAWDDLGPFPDFVAAFLRDPPNPDPWPTRYVASPWLAEGLDPYLRAGRLLLLIDGLNELPGALGPKGAARREHLQAFFRQYPAVRAVVTCRTLDYHNELDLAGFQTVVVDPWSEAQIAHYLQHVGADLLLARLQARDEVLLSLGRVPALLQMLIDLAADYRPPAAAAAAPSFLTSESALFKALVDRLLEWAAARDQDAARLFPRQVVIAALARLAGAMRAAGYRGTPVAHAWAVAHLAGDPQALLAGVPAPAHLPDDPRQVLLDFGCEATILDTPATRTTVRFWHLTHQDYFAALALQQTGPALPAGAPLPDEVARLAAVMAPHPEVTVADLLASGQPRAALLAGQILVSAGGAGGR
ncbi:MAG TPA: NACHT domain-containing protein [Chloroflexia bacterium]|nr:NACHT domain-containing protein [Chloroflexia bacterium]